MNYIHFLQRFLQIQPENYLYLYTAQQHIGYVQQRHLPALKALLPLKQNGKRLDWLENDSEARTAQLQAACQQLAKRGLITGWRNELLPIQALHGGGEIFAWIERAAAALLGIRALGMHLNVYQGEWLWWARRSALKSEAPLRLDQVVAGGISDGLDVRATLLKEGAEEAGLSASLLEKAKAVGVCSYQQETPLGLRCDILYLYDLEVEHDFEPVNQDGEVAEFLRHPIADSEALLPHLKANSTLVLLDFLIRHGHLKPEHPHYLTFCAARAADLTRLP